MMEKIVNSDSRFDDEKFADKQEERDVQKRVGILKQRVKENQNFDDPKSSEQLNEGYETVNEELTSDTSEAPDLK